MSIISVFTSAPRDLVSSVARNASLIWQMTKREVVGRYRGSVFGLAWSFFNPLLMLAVYSFVFPLSSSRDGEAEQKITGVRNLR